MEAAQPVRMQKDPARRGGVEMYPFSPIKFQKALSNYLDVISAGLTPAPRMTNQSGLPWTF